MSTALWYLRRARRMSAGEALWRCAEQWQRRSWASRQVRDHDVERWPCPPLSRAVEFTAALPDDALATVPAAERLRAVGLADAILAGRWRALGVLREDLAAPDWFRDPVTGRQAPGTPYCFRVDHRSVEVTGNVKQVWELSRLQHVTVLAAAWAFTGDEDYARLAAGHLTSWWEANPFLSGVHWTSGIEVGLRLISMVWTRRLLHGWDGVASVFESNPAARAQIWWHQRYLAAFRSRGSSANNHVIAESAGLLTSAIAFPWYRDSERWIDESRRLLETELERNTFPSGVNRELASEYHGFVNELALVAAVEADRSGAPLQPLTWARITGGIDAAAALVDCAGRAPRQGDGDDGRAVVLGDRDSSSWRTLLSAGAGVLGPLPWWPALVPDTTGTLLAALGDRHVVSGRSGERPDRFADAGITILRTPASDRPEIWCRCDSGPHGFLSIAAHAHADALAVEVREDGVDVLADPGTYAYHEDPAWREYFRSTVAHNTVELAGEPQSVPGGPFLWMSQARSTTLDVATTPATGPARWEAEHDGYRRLTPPATHRRRVTLFGPRRRIEITDEIETLGSHPLRLAFHLGPDIDVELAGLMATLSWTGRAGGTRHARLCLPAGLTWTAERGSGTPLGWYSAHLGHKQPCTTLLGAGHSRSGHSLRTVLQFADPDQG